MKAVGEDEGSLVRMCLLEIYDINQSLQAPTRAVFFFLMYNNETPVHMQKSTHYLPVVD